MKLIRGDYITDEIISTTINNIIARQQTFINSEEQDKDQS
jgi:hypothetical protein